MGPLILVFVSVFVTSPSPFFKHPPRDGKSKPLTEKSWTGQVHPTTISMLRSASSAEGTDHTRRRKQIRLQESRFTGKFTRSVQLWNGASQLNTATASGCTSLYKAVWTALRQASCVCLSVYEERGRERQTVRKAMRYSLSYYLGDSFRCHLRNAATT